MSEAKGTHLTLLSNANQLLPLPASANPYTKGEPIVTAADPNGTGLPANTVCPVPNASGNLVGGSVNGAAVSGQVGSQSCGCLRDCDQQRSVRTAFPGFNNINTLRDEGEFHLSFLQVGLQRNRGGPHVEHGIHLQPLNRRFLRPQRYRVRQCL